MNKGEFVEALADALGSSRAEAERAAVEGVFDLSGTDPAVAARIVEAGGEAEDEAILARIIPRTGRARATAGGRTVPLGVLRDAGAGLVSMHGQSEQMTLRQAATQRELLDTAGGPPVAAALDEYRTAYAAWRDVTAEHARL